MSPVTKAAMAMLPGINSITSFLATPQGQDGSAVVDFTDSNVNILPPPIGPGKVGVHIFSIYPACPPKEDGNPRPALLNEEYFAPVFEPSLIADISQLALGNATAMHNVMSHALKDAPICQGERTMVIFTPAANGQRQAYTQFASDLGSLGHIAVTVDHPYLSGFVELADGTIQAGTIRDALSNYKAGFTQYSDIDFLGKALTSNALVDLLPPRFRPAGIRSEFCVFGHGLGGKVAQSAVHNRLAPCGGHLEGFVTLPYPLNEVDVLAEQPPHKALPEPIPDPPTLNDRAVEENAILERSVGGDDCCHNGDWDFRDDGCRHYCDDVDFSDDRGYEAPQHNVDDVPPLPPLDKTRPDNSPWDWDGDWIDYSDNIGNYQGRRHRFPIGPNYPTKPQEPCDDDEGSWDEGCEKPHGGVHEHHHDLPDYPHHGGHHGHPSHGGVHEHHDDWDKYKGDDECESCHGPVGHHHSDWEDVDEGHKWDDKDYDYEEDDDDDDEECADDDEGADDGDDDDECADDDEGGDDDDDDECADDEGADDDDEGADDDEEGADDDEEGADDDEEGADDDEEGAEDDEEGGEDESGCEDEDPCQ